MATDKTGRTCVPIGTSVVEKLQSAGIRLTAQRIRIADVILSKLQHLSAEQVLGRVNTENKSVSRATVYNTLNLFVEKGLVKRVLIDPKKIFYDSNTSAHFHFYNEDTGELSDFNMEDSNLQEMSFLLPDNTVKKGIDVIVHLKHSL